MKKVVLITGSSGLLGQTFVRACIDAGMTVVALDLVRPKKLPSGATFFQCDTTDTQEVKKIVSLIAKTYGSIDGLVNAAYPRVGAYGKKFEAVSYEDFCGNLSAHLGGYFLMTQAVSEVMKRQQSGSIVFIGSIYGSIAPRFEIYEGTTMTMPVEYAAIKGGVVMLAKYLASYLGPYGVRVNVLSPGGILDKQPASFIKKYRAHVKLSKKMASVDDVTGPLLFLLSSASSYITGQNLIVDGGFSL